VRRAIQDAANFITLRSRSAEKEGVGSGQPIADSAFLQILAITYRVASESHEADGAWGWVTATGIAAPTRG
jgi:hypothetical protein